MGIEEKLPAGFLLTTVEQLAGYMRKSSVWPATFGLACCAIEMMAVGTPDYDIARFGMERFSATPRQADLMIVAGRVSQKMAPVVRQVYDQMPEPKWVISMGVCASSGGMFNNYAIVQGVDHIIPVDVYLPGCPPRPRDAAQRDHHAAPADPEHPARRQPRQGGPRRGGGGPEGDADARDEGPAGVTTAKRGHERSEAGASPESRQEVRHDGQPEAAAEGKVGATAEQKVSPTHAQETGGAATAAESDNLPAAPGTTPEPVVIGERHGMFGAAAPAATPPATAAWCRPMLFPGAAVAPLRRLLRRGGRLPRARPGRGRRRRLRPRRSSGSSSTAAR